MSIRRWLFLASVLSSLLLVPATSFAAKGSTIKLATLVPDGSPWHMILSDMGSAWSDATEGRVSLRVYPGGVAGDDPDMVRKMRIGQLHAASLTVTGLVEVDPSFNVMSIPLLFESHEEYIFVRNKMTATFAARLEAKGFVMLHWGHGGWVHFFAKNPVRTVDEMRKVKVFTWAGDENMAQAYRNNGFQPVALAATDILTGLQTGMIDAIPVTPLAALSLQWFRQTPYMLNTPIAPLIGATVIVKKHWEALSQADRAKMLEAARLAEQKIDEEIPVKDQESIQEMAKRGLNVLKLETSEQEADWRRIAVDFTARMSSIVPKEVFDEAMGYRAEYRKQQAQAAGR